ncbi:MAG: hypothetical protein QM719_10020 [Thermomonas sp.]
MRREIRRPPKTFFDTRRCAPEPLRRVADVAAAAAFALAHAAMRCESRSCFQGFFRERIRGRHACGGIDVVVSRAAQAIARRPRRERPGTFVLQKC